MSVMSLLSGCATFNSDIEGRFESPAKEFTGADKVSVLFILRHIKQAKGLDAIPKLQSEKQIVRDFDNIFQEALSELSNLSNHATFTEFPSDVSKPKRRDERDTMMSEYDFVFRITITKEHSFIKHFLGQVCSAFTLTILPVPYSRSYSIDVNVHNAEGAIIRNYKREATLTTWVEAFLIVLQPFHNKTIKQERIYIEFLHDIFRQIETERLLTDDER